MKAEFLEKYETLGSLLCGDLAVSKDRSKLFLCLWIPNADMSDCYKGVIELTDPHNQYIHKLEMEQPVRKLVRGDKYLIER